MFDGVDLEDSPVLGWRFDSAVDQLVFDLVVSLWQGHQHYAPPLLGEYTCYKRGSLIFDFVTSINGLLPMNAVKYTTDPDGSIDYGYIEGLRYSNDNKYNFEGDFGEVSVQCQDVCLKINDV
ncbi:MAG: hypothetical protein LH472_08430 [Pyrinomonadaceae bacterium]|nr:hypothetical protein [Pyrinomonadaceae bacterium]